MNATASPRGDWTPATLKAQRDVLARPGTKSIAKDRLVLDVAARHRLSRSAVAVGYLLLDRCNRSNLRCDQSHAGMAEKLGISVRSVKAACDELRATGLFGWKSHGSARSHCNQYWIDWIALAGPSPEREPGREPGKASASEQGAENRTLKGAENCTQTRKEEPEKKKPHVPNVEPHARNQGDRPKGIEERNWRTPSVPNLSSSRATPAKGLRNLQPFSVRRTTPSFGEAARNEAEKRWLRPFERKWQDMGPHAYSVSMDAITPDVITAATVAEMRNPTPHGQAGRAIAEAAVQAALRQRGVA